MHAFDGGKLTNIQVATAAKGEKFTTLDGVTRTMPDGTLMIQSNRKKCGDCRDHGGAASEVGRGNGRPCYWNRRIFDAPTIRRAATAMGHRTKRARDLRSHLIRRIRCWGYSDSQACEGGTAGTDAGGHDQRLLSAPKQIKPITLDVAFASRIVGQGT